MNPYSNLIFLNNKKSGFVDKTKEVERCHYQTGKYEIQFTNNTQTYTYDYEKVRWYQHPIEQEPESFHIYHNGKKLYHIKKIIVFDNFWRIFFENGNSIVYEKSKLEIQENLLKQADSKNLWDYYTAVADKTGMIRNGENTLLNQYVKTKFISDQSVLNLFFNENEGKNGKDKNETIIFPFGCNASQIAAVQRAMTHRITIIEGPPGTGKTQTILNIIANILMKEQNVAVVSSNNSATDNVKEKLEKYQYGFLSASLGNDDNKKNFMESGQMDYPDFLNRKWDSDYAGNLDKQVKQNLLLLEDILQKQNKVAKLKQVLESVKLEQKYFTEYAEETFEKIDPFYWKKKVNAKTTLELWILCENKQKNGRLTFWNKLRFLLLTGNYELAFKEKNVKNMITIMQSSYYDLKIKELQQQISELQQNLEQQNFSQEIENLQRNSEEILRCMLVKKYGGKEQRKKFAIEDLWKNAEEFIREYPVILSTTYSLKKSLHPDFLYDYVIVDEASQVDMTTGVLAMLCAKNIVIVGDRMQLPNVIPENIRKSIKEVSKQADIAEKYQYETNSLLSAVLKVFRNSHPVLLREHYRCHPKIIQFCSQKFYNDQLIIMTKDEGEEDVLKVYKTVMGNHSRGHYNQRQIDEIKERVLPELIAGNDFSDIGIISPYNMQKDALEKEITDIDISTVHKFQGREKDDIIICTVDNEITPFTDNSKMLNVAVSRAKKRLRVVLSDNEKNENTNIGDLVKYIQYHNFEVVKGEVYSVFDLLYKEYTGERKKYLASHRKVSQYDSENLLFVLLEEILSKQEFCKFASVVHQPMNMLIRDLKKLTEDEINYVMNLATHVDFLLYNRVNKEPILVIEADGYQFHKEGTRQNERDKMKADILAKYHIPLLRLNTVGSREKERIVDILHTIIKGNQETFEKKKGEENHDIVR